MGAGIIVADMFPGRENVNSLHFPKFGSSRSVRSIEHHLPDCRVFADAHSPILYLRAEFQFLKSMFIGHFGVGLALKRAAPAVSLGTLFLAAQFIDLLWPLLLLMGVERVEIAPGNNGPPLDFVHYPISHSLLMVILWGLLFGGSYWLLRRNKVAAIVCGVAVVSHWFLDLLVHHPDLPIAPGSEQYVGFGLWHSLWGSMLVEGLVFVFGVWVYCRVTEASSRIGHWGFWGLIAFLAVVHCANVFGAPPPSDVAVAWVGQAQWILIIWAYWVDRHRGSRTLAAP